MLDGARVLSSELSMISEMSAANKRWSRWMDVERRTN